MARVNVNLETAPDKFESVPPGIYTCVVDEANLEATNDGKGQKVVVKLRVDDDGPQNGRLLFDHLGLKTPIGLKQITKSAGLPVTPEGIDTEDLIGKHVRVRVAARSYKDPKTGEMKETSSITEYLF